MAANVETGGSHWGVILPLKEVLAMFEIPLVPQQGGSWSADNKWVDTTRHPTILRTAVLSHKKKCQ